MDWRSITFDWNQARAFLVTAEEGSLSAAARALGMTQPTLGRQVSALETELGVSLFDRVGRGLSLTPAGGALLEHVRAMGAAAGHLSLTATGQAQRIEGIVRITASEVTAAHMLPPIVHELRQHHPGIEVEIVATNALQDLRRREADIAIRNARPEDPDLFARKLGEDQAHFYAAPAYLDQIGPIDGPGDLARANFIWWEDARAFESHFRARGLPVSAKSVGLRSESQLMQWALVTQGCGIGMVPRAMGDADPRVVRVLPRLEPVLYPVWLTAHRDLVTSRRIRLVFDLLAERLSEQLKSGG